MERQLKKYRIDQSTPTSGRYGSVSSPDSGLATRPSEYTFDYEGDSTLTSDRDQLRVDREQSRLPRRDSHISTPRASSPLDGAKVRFASDQYDKESDYPGFSDDNLFSTNVRHRPVKADVKGMSFETSRKGMNKKAIIKPATYDGSSSWLDYKCHFEACESVNGWNEETKGMFTWPS